MSENTSERSDDRYPAGWLRREVEAAAADVEACPVLRRWARGEYHRGGEASGR